MKPYSQDLRERVVAAVDRNERPVQDIAHTFGVSRRWVSELLKRRRETGSFAARPHSGGAAPLVSPEQDERLRQLAVDRPDATLAELRDACRLKVSLTTVWKHLHRYGLTGARK